MHGRVDLLRIAGTCPDENSNGVKAKAASVSPLNGMARNSAANYLGLRLDAPDADLEPIRPASGIVI
jgi:hypothetical protein